MDGYASAEYASAFTAWGQPEKLPEAAGWLLSRDIPGTTWADYSGCYPLFSCKHPELMEQDLSALNGGHVSLSMVLDPFTCEDSEDLHCLFPDVFLHFKDHYITDLSENLEKSVSSHHRYYARRSLRNCQVDVEPDPVQILDIWVELYDQLIERHDIRGLQRFSRESFARQLAMDSMMAFLARNEDQVLGIQLWLMDEKNVFHHLSAYSQAGYQSRVSYGLLWSALQHFRMRGFERADLGGDKGINGKDSGLAQFKSGWADTSLPVYFGGRILDHDKYAQLTAGHSQSDYFPRYRAGEFR